MELKGSRTEANLLTAFSGESQARNKYTFYASKAKKEGYEQIAAIFEETANNEKEMCIRDRRYALRYASTIPESGRSSGGRQAKKESVPGLIRRGRSSPDIFQHRLVEG